MVKEIDIQIHGAQRVPNKLDPKRNTSGHIIIKLPKIKDKERILKAAREKKRVTYKGVPIRLSAKKQNRNRVIGMEIIWRVICWMGEEGEWGKRCRD